MIHKRGWQVDNRSYASNLPIVGAISMEIKGIDWLGLEGSMKQFPIGRTESGQLAFSLVTGKVENPPPGKPTPVKGFDSVEELFAAMTTAIKEEDIEAIRSFYNWAGVSLARQDFTYTEWKRVLTLTKEFSNEPDPLNSDYVSLIRGEVPEHWRKSGGKGTDRIDIQLWVDLGQFVRRGFPGQHIPGFSSWSVEEERRYCPNLDPVAVISVQLVSHNEGMTKGTDLISVPVGQHPDGKFVLCHEALETEGQREKRIARGEQPGPPPAQPGFGP